jgi:hypothetical protein
MAPTPGDFEFVEAALDHVSQDVNCGMEGPLDQPVDLSVDNALESTQSLKNILSDR